jgi:anion-transporting  ArsA/GET3 family ATPase
VQLDRPLTIVTGKGGVGRSAVTAALATVSAASGRSVLALATGDAAGLAAHLGTGPLGAEPSRIDDGIWAAGVDPVAALDEYVRLKVGPVPLRMAGRVFGAIAQTVPGIRDVVVMGKCLYEAGRDRWDHVVVDAAPTGQIESLLAAPSTIGDLVGRGPVHEQARDLEADLADGAITSLIAVATPTELALTEAAEFSAASEQMGLAGPVRTIHNRVIGEPGFTDPPPEPGPHREAAVLTLQLLARQVELLGATAAADASLPLFHGAEPAELRHAMAEVLSA